MTSKNKFDPEVALLNQVTDLLMDERVKQNEREILLYAKHQLEHHVNMPNIIYHLKNILTPCVLWLNLMHMLSIYDDNVEKKPFLLELYM